MLGAGMVIIQPSSGKVVLIWESKRKYWFLPKGRKDQGESLEQAVLREAYEESGYRVSFLPLCMNTHAPTPPGSPRRKGDAVYTEAIYVSTIYWGPTPKRPSRSTGEYLVHWYVGQIPEDAVPEADTGMADEKNYESHLVEREQAYELLGGFEGAIVKRAFDLWDETRKIKKYYAERRERGKRDSEWSEVNVEWQAQGQSSAANEEQRQR